MEENLLFQEKLAYICAAFRLPGRLTHYRRLDGGKINASFVVTLRAGEADRRYFIQQVNRYVFRDPVSVMENICRITEYLMAQDCETLRFYTTAEGRGYLLLGEGEEFWRATDFIEDAVSFQTADGNSLLLERAGQAFGSFLRQLWDFDVSQLTETIPRFHDTEFRLKELFRAAEEAPLERSRDAEEEIALVRANRDSADMLRRCGALPLRVTHNDTKLSNILFCRETLEPLAVVDLDTCMPGLICHDFGDTVRSAARRTETPSPRLDLSLFRAYTEGFLGETAGFLTEAELASLAPGAAVITLELAARFLTDHLAGDRYFRTEYPGQNLDRAREQLALFQDMTRKMETMEEIVWICAEGKYRN